MEIKSIELEIKYTYFINIFEISVSIVKVENIKLIFAVLCKS